ncbi:MAG: GNAT family N-acetyltransferase [Rhodospirillaceae bacterium]|nr:GNAT family N-acetyltransferase [Rhodospirillaceae bacterium]|tara:strand:+ start:1158 stop:1649 length:492 start_codon:yes stop_codon:yes gene_type:complete
MFEIFKERPQDVPAIESLLDTAFGANRHARASYALRENIEAIPELCLTARRDSVILGTIRYWPLLIPGARSGLLLGPIAVDPAHGKLGIGGKLIEQSLSDASILGHDAVVAIGNADYLSRFGFCPAGQFGLTFTTPLAPGRLHALELFPGALAGAGGRVAKAL